MVLKDASRDTDSEYPAEPVGPAESRMATSKKVCKAGAYLWALLIASMCHCSHFFLEGYKQANTRPLDKGLIVAQGCCHHCLPAHSLRGQQGKMP